MGRGSPSMSTVTSTSDSFSSSIPEADRKFLYKILLIVFDWVRQFERILSSLSSKADYQFVFKSLFIVF